MEQITNDVIPMGDKLSFIYRNKQFAWQTRRERKCPVCKGLVWRVDTSRRFQQCMTCGAIFDRLEARKRGPKP